MSGSRGTWYLGGMAELSISTTDDDTCGDLCKYRCGNCQGSLVGLQITAYAISEGGQRHQSLSLSLRPSSVRHFQLSMLPGTIEINATSPSWKLSVRFYKHGHCWQSSRDGSRWCASTAPRWHPRMIISRATKPTNHPQIVISRTTRPTWQPQMFIYRVTRPSWITNKMR